MNMDKKIQQIYCHMTILKKKKKLSIITKYTDYIALMDGREKWLEHSTLKSKGLQNI